MGYQQPYYVQIQKPPSNGLAITSMILGIVAAFWLLFVVGASAVSSVNA
jgi:hypothetical protein